MSPTRLEFIKAAAATGAMVEAVDASGAHASQSGNPMPTARAKALMELFDLKYPIFEALMGPKLARNLKSRFRTLARWAHLQPLTVRRWRIPPFRKCGRGRRGSSSLTSFFSLNRPRFRPLDAGAPIVQFSWGMPTRQMISAVRAAHATLGVQVTSAESARAALDLGAGFLVCQGTEAGDHVQATRGLYETLPIVLEEAREKPVVAAGGIGNGQGLYKALSAGASAVALGTRFVATVESRAHPDYKRAILAAHAKDTALTNCFQGGDGWSATHRALRNRTFVMWDVAGCPSPGKRPGESDVIATRADGSKILRYEDWSPLRGFGGAVTECRMWAGMGVDYIKDLPAAGELVGRLWRECEAARPSAHSGN